MEGVYIRLLPSEIPRVEVSEEGVLTDFKLSVGTLTFKVRRVRVAGHVVAVSDRGRMAEVIVSDGQGEVKVRAWDEEAKKLLELKPGDLVEVLGSLRVFRGDLYVACRLLRKIGEKDLNEYVNRLKRDREVLASRARAGSTVASE